MCFVQWIEVYILNYLTEKERDHTYTHIRACCQLSELPFCLLVQCTCTYEYRTRKNLSENRCATQVDGQRERESGSPNSTLRCSHTHPHRGQWPIGCVLFANYNFTPCYTTYTYFRATIKVYTYLVKQFT